MKKYLFMLMALFLIEMCPITINRLDANEKARGLFSGNEKRKALGKMNRKKVKRNTPAKKKNNKPISKTVYPF